jgi:hypothetical protein
VALPKDLLRGIFELQTELMEDYKKIEGWEVEFPVNLNSKKAQLLVKDVISRGVEELAEAYEAMELGQDDNFLEELGDALHFFVEVFILAGLTVGDFRVFLSSLNPEAFSFDKPGQLLKLIEQRGIHPGSLARASWTVTYRVNLSRNALRNKPWKQTELMYNREVFEENLFLGFLDFLELFVHKAEGANQVYAIYFLKNKINKFRIRSKY